MSAPNFPSPEGQPMQDPVGLTFKVRQKITFMVNRYEIRAVDAAGKEAGLMAYAQQKRMAFKEQVRFYADEQRQQVVFGFKARQHIDLAATYDITDAQGAVIGQFRKVFGKSLFNSTWDLSTPDGFVAQGTERNAAIALLRRFWDFVPFIGEIPIPFLFHFDFRAPDGTVVMSCTKKMGLRDSYTVHLPEVNGWQLDWRVGAAMAVALDALQSR